ncbi:M14 family metallopeptidase [Sphingomonas sp.]
MIVRTTTLALMAPMLLAQTLMAQTRPEPAPLPPVLPWSGASERLIVPDRHPWATPAERARFETTPDYAETRAWLEKLAAASPLLSIERFGTSAEGRELYAVRASKGGGTKPVVLAQAGIHAGEIDGKDAGMMLLRDIAFGGKAALLDRADLMFVPIFNVDGHERASAWNRPNQRGPREMGWRTNAQNLNLNRDYLKADTPEMRAMLALIRRTDPALYLDLHVTDGTDYQYDITYAFSGWRGHYARSKAIGRWLDERLRPAMDRALERNGHVPGLYVDAIDNRDPWKGIAHNPDTPRFSTGWGDHARVPTVLLETHSLKPYRQRVLGTYVFIEEALRLVGAEGAGLRKAIASDRAERPRDMVVTWTPLKKPIYSVRFKGVAYDTYRSQASGREELRWLGTPDTRDMPVFGQAPDRRVALPRAWWVPVSAPQAIERLRAQGVVFDTITEARTLTLEMVRIVDPKLGPATEGHVPLTAGGYVPGERRVTMPAGSVRVPVDQPLALVAAAMLEPENPDSLLSWNLFPGMLARTEYIEGYAIAPLADRMLARDPKLRAEFDAKLRAEPEFAKNPNARLAWFYERTPYYDERYLLYPIGRERGN